MLDDSARVLRKTDAAPSAAVAATAIAAPPELAAVAVLAADMAGAPTLPDIEQLLDAAGASPAEAASASLPPGMEELSGTAPAAARAGEIHKWVAHVSHVAALP